MQIILNQDIKDLGKKGQLVNVSDGYAKNYLLPRKLAVIAAVVLAVASVIVFFITEDLTNSMALVDRYTLIMQALLFKDTGRCPSFAYVNVKKLQ